MSIRHKNGLIGRNSQSAEIIYDPVIGRKRFPGIITRISGRIGHIILCGSCTRQQHTQEYKNQFFIATHPVKLLNCGID